MRVRVRAWCVCVLVHRDDSYTHVARHRRRRFVHDFKIEARRRLMTFGANVFR